MSVRNITRDCQPLKWQIRKKESSECESSTSLNPKFHSFRPILDSSGKGFFKMKGMKSRFVKSSL